MSSVFISFSSADEHEARLVAALCSEQGTTPWFMARSMRSGDWQIQIDNAIKNCDLVIVLVSQASNRPTSYVKNEILLARRLEKPIAPIVIDGVSLPTALLDLHAWSWNRKSSIDLQNIILEIILGTVQTSRKNATESDTEEDNQFDEKSESPPILSRGPSYHTIKGHLAPVSKQTGTSHTFGSGANQMKADESPNSFQLKKLLQLTIIASLIGLAIAVVIISLL